MNDEEIVKEVSKELGQVEPDLLREKSERLLRRLKKNKEREKLVFLLLEASRSYRERSGIIGKFVKDFERNYPLILRYFVRNTLKYMNDSGLILFKKISQTQNSRKGLMFEFNFNNIEAIFFWDTLKYRVSESCQKTAESLTEQEEATSTTTNGNSTTKEESNSNS